MPRMREIIQYLSFSDWLISFSIVFSRSIHAVAKGRIFFLFLRPTYHLTPVRMAIINKSTNNKCWRGCGERGPLLLCWWECISLQPLWKTVWRYLKKLKIDLPFDPVIPLLRIYLKEPKTLIQKNINTLCSLQRYLQSPRYGSSPSVHQ